MCASPKKGLFLLSAVALTVGMLSACGSTEASSENGKETKAVHTADKEKDKAKNTKSEDNVLPTSEEEPSNKNQVSGFGKLFSIAGNDYGLNNIGISTRQNGEAEKYTALKDKLGVAVYKKGEGENCPADSIIFSIFSTGVLSFEPEAQVKYLNEALGYGVDLKTAGPGIKDVLTDARPGSLILASIPSALNPDHFALPSQASTLTPQLYNFHVKQCLSHAIYAKAMSDFKYSKPTGNALEGVQVIGKPGKSSEIKIEAKDVPEGKQVAILYEGRGPEVGKNDQFIIHTHKAVRKYLKGTDIAIERHDSDTYQMPGAMPMFYIPGKDDFFDGDGTIKQGSRQIVVQRVGDLIVVWVNDLVYKF